MENVNIFCGDALNELKKLPDKIVQTCITSPPYWNLRDYGVEGQIGLEETPDEYVNNLVAVFREVNRVLRDDGTLWLNLGDSYMSHLAISKNVGGFEGAQMRKNQDYSDSRIIGKKARPQAIGLKDKDLVGMPWLMAFALRNDGWYLRSDIIWSKSNIMPESVRDRPTQAHEHIFLFAKSARYYYDSDAIRETSEWGQEYNNPEWNVQRRITNEQKGLGNSNAQGSGFSNWQPSYGRNKRNVWHVNTRPYPGAHFAVYPPELIEPCVLAGSSDQACPECGAPWQRKIERPKAPEEITREMMPAWLEANPPQTIGWEPTCDCKDNDGSSASIVLDPFLGSGTTGFVAVQNRRRFIGIELNEKYVDIAMGRLKEIQVALF